MVPYFFSEIYLLFLVINNNSNNKINEKNFCVNYLYENN